MITNRDEIVQQFASGILQRLPARTYVTGAVIDEAFQEALQDAISGVLAGLEDSVQADLYARIVSGLEQGVGTLASLIVYEVRATNLWSAI